MHEPIWACWPGLGSRGWRRGAPGRSPPPSPGIRCAWCWIGVRRVTGPSAALPSTHPALGFLRHTQLWDEWWCLWEDGPCKTQAIFCTGTTYKHTHTLAHAHSLSLTHMHTLSRTHTCTHTLSQRHAHTLACTHTQTLSHSLSHTHTHTLIDTHTHPNTHTETLLKMYAHTITQTCTHTCMLAHTLAWTHTHWHLLSHARTQRRLSHSLTLTHR